MTLSHEFVVPADDDNSIEDFFIGIKMQGQMGNFFINGHNRWHFSLLLDRTDEPFLVGSPSHFTYGKDWNGELKSGENIVEYIPMRQAGSTDEQQHIELDFTLNGEQIYLINWGPAELIDNKKITIKVIVEQPGLGGNSETEIDDKNLTIKKVEF